MLIEIGLACAPPMAEQKTSIKARGIPRRKPRSTGISINLLQIPFANFPKLHFLDPPFLLVSELLSGDLDEDILQGWLLKAAE